MSVTQSELLAPDIILPDGSRPVALGSGKIVAKLGEGGVAVVYEIYNERLGVSRAVKLIRPGTNALSLKRFNTEMSLMAQLRHPNIVDIHTVGEWFGLPYIEMEKIEGVSLDTLLAGRGAFPFDVALAIGIMVCRALDFIHNHEYVFEGKRYPGMLHRDLKPANILIEKNGMVKLTDFGIATPKNVSLHTVDGSFVGSLLYISPEQLIGEHGDPRSDLFSLGCVMYEMVTGNRTFPLCEISNLFEIRRANRFEPLNSFKLSIPSGLRKVIEKCLAGKPDLRVPGAAVAFAELDKIYRQLSKLPPEQTVSRFLQTEGGKHVVPRYRKYSTVTGTMMILGIGAVLTVFFAGGLITFLRNRHDRTTARELESILLMQPAHFTSRRKPQEPAEEVQPAPGKTGTPRRRILSRHVPDRLWNAAVIGRPVTGSAQLLAALRKEYRDADMMTILSGELHKGNYIRAWETYESLTGAGNRAKSGGSFAGTATGSDYRRLMERFFLKQETLNREFFLVRARYYYRVNRYHEAFGALKRAESIPGPIDDIGRTILWYSALCATNIFEESKNDSWKETAARQWREAAEAFAAAGLNGHARYAESRFAALE